MTVKDLIDRLTALPPNAVVNISTCEGGDLVEDFAIREDKYAYTGKPIVILEE